MPAAALREAENVPAATLIAAAKSPGKGAAAPVQTPPNAAFLVHNSKPEVFFACFVGLPGCAQESWVLVMALSQFGSFVGLRGAVPNPLMGTSYGLVFYGARFSSRDRLLPP